MKLYCTHSRMPNEPLVLRTWCCVGYSDLLRRNLRRLSTNNLSVPLAETIRLPYQVGYIIYKLRLNNTNSKYRNRESLEGREEPQCTRWRRIHYSSLQLDDAQK
jgi:hypothetical protein